MSYTFSYDGEEYGFTMSVPEDTSYERMTELFENFLRFSGFSASEESEVGCYLNDNGAPALKFDLNHTSWIHDDRVL